jgi:histone-lysine N-methyltransferase SETMAR
VSVSYSTVIRHLPSSLGMKDFYLRWMPYELTSDLHCRRLEMRGRLLPMLEVRELDLFRMLVTEDESWLLSEYQHSTKWSVARDEVPTRVSQTIGTKTVMLTLIWGIDGFHVVNMMPLGGCFNIEYFLTHITDPLLAKAFPEGRKSHALQLSVHLHHCRIHSSNASKQFFDGNSLVAVPHPPYNPDLAPSDFWLFRHIKIFRAGRVFNDADELLEAVIEFLNEIQPSELQVVFHHSIERVKWVLANNEDYCHE